MSRMCQSNAKQVLLLLLLMLGTSIISLSLATNGADSADLTGNQIQDERGSHLGRGRHLFKGCKACGTGKCQVMGMQRYAEPRCEALGGLGSPCRPFQEPENKTLHFPNAIMICSDVYMQFCPCAQGLTCDLDQAECSYPASDRGASRSRQRELGGASLLRPFVLGPLESGDEAYDDEWQDRIPEALEPIQEERTRQSAVSWGGPGGRKVFPWAVARFH